MLKVHKHVTSFYTHFPLKLKTLFPFVESLKSVTLMLSNFLIHRFQDNNGEACK